MPFVIGVDNADAFNKYMINVMVTTASVAWLFLLFIRSVDKKVLVYRKPFSVAMSLQLLFVTLRNLSTMMLSSVSVVHLRHALEAFISFHGGFFVQLEERRCFFPAPPFYSSNSLEWIISRDTKRDKKRLDSTSIPPPEGVGRVI